MNPQVKIRFPDVESGWLAIEILIGDVAFQNSVSYSPNDALSEFANAGLAVLEATQTFIVTLHLEPTEIELVFRPKECGTEITMTQWANHRRGVGDPIVLACQVFARSTVATAIWRALRDLESRWATGHYTSEWRRQFPKEKVQKLGTTLARGQYAI